jgi:hypothetical protein
VTRALRPFLAILLATLLPVCGGGGVHAADLDSPTAREDQLKAAFLFNFVKFVEWPASPAEDALTVCFVDAQGVYDALATGIEAKRVGARRLVVRRLDKSASPKGCDALYANSTTVPEAPALADSTARPILTVSDTREFARKGGIIGLFTESNRLRFSINIANAQKAGLRISSNLLQLAASVERESQL